MPTERRYRMIKIENLNKYFNRHKKNQIHVINNTSLTLEDKGLVALLGPSGSGKTTLLNAIGGLDKVKSESIYIDVQKITSKWIYKVDKIRNLNIGYIFQDYKLVDNLSVYDNVSLVLKMIGIKDKKEIDKRVRYVLEKVGMYRYRKRPANMLSGGERQRVGIARAIVKNPHIIIADEPTGNLDSKNSLEIMNIIKAISKDRLVILVTHETNLAKFYASRIIEIADGKIINDYENVHNEELDYAIDNRFYLKDFENQETITNSDSTFKIYSDQKPSLQLDIVIKNDNIYIRSKQKEKIEVVEEGSNIEMIDDHYKKMDKATMEQYEFNFKDIIDDQKKLKYSSIFNPLTFITNGFKKVLNYSILKKILLGGFFLSGIFIMFAVSRIVANLTIHDEDFIKTNPNYLLIEAKTLNVEDYLKYSQEENINYIFPGNSEVNFIVPLQDYYQTSRYTLTLTGSLASTQMIKKEDLILGRMPENKEEIIVDSLAIQRLLNDNVDSKMAGLASVSDFLNRDVQINLMNKFKIVGITDLNNPSIYVEKEQMVPILYNTLQENGNGSIESSGNTMIQSYELLNDQISLVKGNWPTNDYETIVNIENQEQMPLNKEISTSINGKKLKVVGYYSSENPINYYLVNQKMILYQLIKKSQNITVYPKSKEEVLISLQEKYSVNIEDSYTKSKDVYIASRKENITSSLISSGIILAISLIEIFLMIRSSFLSRVKEVGIYRAIGVKKKDIYIMFSGEIIAITTLASLPGIILCAYILNIMSGISILSREFTISIPLVLLATLFIYLFNLLVGLMPVFNTIRKRPAEILARTDVE